MASFAGKEDIPDHWLCPVCLEIPEKEVYQCRDGHLLCNICYFQVTDAVCPQCRKPLDRDDPIRNRMMEEVFDGFKVNCRFKPNGCDKRLSKKSVEKHEIACGFDFNKFGEFVKICERIGFTYCDFKCNNGNAKETVDHFVSEHGCILTTSEKFRMELISFKKSAKAGGSGFHFWTPIIANLKERKCYLLTMVVLNKMDASFTWLSIFLPYPTKEHRDISLVEIEYTMDTGETFPLAAWIGRTMSLKQANKILPDQIDFVNYSLSFVRGCSKEGSLLIDCNIRRQGVAVREGTEQMQSLVCTRNTNSFSVVDNIQPQTFKVPIRFYGNEGSSAAKSFRDKLKKDCRSDRNNLLPSMRNLFDGEKPASLTSEDVEWLKMDLIFITAQYGNVEALKYLIGKGINFNIVDEIGTTPLHYTIRDRKIGLEKAKLLVNSGIADVHALTVYKWSVLLWAVRFGSTEAVEYFLQKGCDVNAQTYDGCTPLHLAVSHGSEEEGLKIAKSLLANGADLSIRNDSGKSALDWATENGKTRIAQLLRLHQSN